jgi:hypothetical protein
VTTWQYAAGHRWQYDEEPSRMEFDSGKATKRRKRAFVAVRVGCASRNIPTWSRTGASALSSAAPVLKWISEPGRSRTFRSDGKGSFRSIRLVSATKLSAMCLARTIRNPLFAAGSSLKPGSASDRAPRIPPGLAPAFSQPSSVRDTAQWRPSDHGSPTTTSCPLRLSSSICLGAQACLDEDAPGVAPAGIEGARDDYWRVAARELEPEVDPTPDETGERDPQHERDSANLKGAQTPFGHAAAA